MILYLTTHIPSWLGRVDYPLCLNRRVMLRSPRRPRRARAPWMLDSGGFNELRLHGEYSCTIDTYAAEIRRYADVIGGLRWVAPMDYMCEPNVIARTGLTVRAHQHRTIANYHALRDALTGDGLAGIVAPILQGWERDDYDDHVDMWTAAGVDLRAAPVVGVGSVCRRNSNRAIHTILRGIALHGIATHAFGVRAPALGGVADVVASADTLAWSIAARYEARAGAIPDHPHPRGAKSCANCPVYADRWRLNMIRQLGTSLLYTPPDEEAA